LRRKCVLSIDHSEKLSNTIQPLSHKVNHEENVSNYSEEIDQQLGRNTSERTNLRLIKISLSPIKAYFDLLKFTRAKNDIDIDHNLLREIAKYIFSVLTFIYYPDQHSTPLHIKISDNDHPTKRHSATVVPP